MNQHIQTVAEIVKKRIERFNKQESNLGKEIERIEKRIADVPKLKQKKKAVTTRRKAELVEIQELTKIVSESELTIEAK